jgi:hypothetical protein
VIAARVVIATTLVLAACVSVAAKTGCPATYEGQTTSVTGVITASANVFGLTQLTTVRDASGSSCLLVSRSVLGKEGDTITAANQIAITNNAKVPPKYLYPASDPDLAK